MAQLAAAESVHQSTLLAIINRVEIAEFCNPVMGANSAAIRLPSPILAAEIRLPAGPRKIAYQLDL
jgi:hypothetical protein